MSKKDWKNQNFIIGSPDSSKDDFINIPILGTTEIDKRKVMNNAFRNACTLLKDAISDSEYSQIILVSFSSELFLKAIIYKTNNTLVKGHDLYELFFNLNQKERDFLIFSYGERNLPKEIIDTDLDDNILQVMDAFENSLAINAMCFETLRYKHELSSYAYSKAFAVNFATDLMQLGKTLGFSE